MLEGKNLYFVKFEHREGTSAKGVDYEFSNITLSDGLESFQLPLDINLVKQAEQLNRKDKINIVVDLQIGFNNRINLKVIEITKLG